jgi:biopolymer transport protein ExbB
MQTFFNFVRGGGWVMVPLLLLSIGALAVIIERLVAFRSLGSTAPGLLPQVLKLARARRFDEAIKICDAQNGPLAACLATVLHHRDRPVGVAERQVEEVGGDYFVRLERFLPFLDTVTTIAPLLGLLGTIVGMIGTFNAISAQQTRGNSDAVLSGVGEALYATATGITIAVVCFVAYNFFAARLRSITAQTEGAATKLINALVNERAGFFPAQDAVVNANASEVNGAVQTAARA